MRPEEYRFFLRYLKERGLFKQFCAEIRRQPSRRNNENFNDVIEESPFDSTEILMRFICWSEAEYKFWGVVYREYQNYFRKEFWRL